MRSMRAPGITGMALMLAACHLQGVPTPVRPHTSAAVPTGVVAASPAAAASPGAPKPPAPPALLQRPAGEVATLSGRVQIDASYVIANNAGNLISEHGAGLISEHGAGVLAAGGGHLDGGALISEKGLGVVATASGNVIANNAGNVISEHGAGLVSKVKYGLLDAAAPGYGDQLPAAGMRLAVIDMTTGKPIGLGTDGAGKPVTSIYTNLDGAFEVYLPAAQALDVRVEALVPGVDDPRLVYSLVMPPEAKDRHLDEITAASTRYVRQVFQGKFLNFMATFDRYSSGEVTDDQLVQTLFVGNKWDPAVQNLLKGFLGDLCEEMRANPRITKNDYLPLGLALGDLLLAQGGDLEEQGLVPAFFQGPAQGAAIANDPYHDAKVLAAFDGIMGEIRDKVTQLGHGKTPDQVAALFASKPYLAAANRYHARTHPGDPVPFYKIAKPTDVADFLVSEYLPLIDKQAYGCNGPDCPDPDPACQLADGCFPQLGVRSITNGEVRAMEDGLMTDLGLPVTHIDVLYAGSASLLGNLVVKCLDPAVQAQMHCLIRSYGQDAPAACDAAASP